MHHFDAGVRHWLVQLTTSFGESETLAGLRSIAAAQNLPGVRWVTGVARRPTPPGVGHARSVFFPAHGHLPFWILPSASALSPRYQMCCQMEGLPLPPLCPAPPHLRRNMKAFITTRLIDHYEMLIWAQGERGTNPKP